MSYIISCCSTTDLTNEHFKKLDVPYICFHYSIDGQEHLDDLGASIPLDKFYEMMKNGADTKTSQVSVGEYEEHFRKLLSTGKDVIHVSLSSGISNSYRSATIAADTIRQEFPNQKLYVVDSLAASSGYGLLVDAMAQKRDEGMTIDELNEWVIENRLNLHHWFFSTDLTFYVKGGRVSKVSGMIGGVFEICPLLNVNSEGKLIPRAKIRTKKKVTTEIVNRMIEHAENGTDYSGKCFMSNSACFDDAKAVADLVEKNFKKIDGGVKIFDIGTVIGSHTGPGTVALFFWGDRRGI